ncbi:MAG: CPBP family intramembrane glutamate endopeptidase, partial [Candidatus Bathyarchaeales archaeon]
MEKGKKLINWKLFLILFVASICSVVAVLPYALTLQADFLEEVPVPLSVLLLTQFLQNVVLFAVFIFVGLYLAKRVGLGTPILESWLEGKEVKSYLKSILGISIALGVLVGTLIIGIDFLFSVFVKPIT